jgi:hypothetical protein
VHSREGILLLASHGPASAKTSGSLGEKTGDIVFLVFVVLVNASICFLLPLLGRPIFKLKAFHLLLGFTHLLAQRCDGLCLVLHLSPRSQKS